MGAFEFVLSLFGLLLGLSLAEVLTGLVRTVKSRQAVRLGWLTPLLGLFVMVDLTSFWSVAWMLREDFSPTFALLLLGLAVTGLYYFAASLVFPERTEEWPDLDTYYFAHKRAVLGSITVCNLVPTLTILALFPERFQLASFWLNGVLLALLVGAVVARNKAANLVLLALLLLFYGFFVVMSLLPAPRT